jgi:hypothetical protein
MKTELTTYGPLKMCLETKPGIFAIRWEENNL